MNKFFLALFTIVLAVSFSLSAQDNKKGTQETKDKKVEVVSEKLNTVCPVSNEEADSKIVAEYNGKKVALCCKTCLKKFQKNPEKYMKKLEQNKEKS